ncbi:MAG TPA: tyrosine--tRNA ligase, partial [bacterium]|nr:tyrosine--tRNA ligase [bacterium]
DFTGRIGDPTGRSETRTLLDAGTIERNLRSYREQAGRILDLDRIEFVHNADWLGKLTLSDVIKTATSFTVAQMLEREDFSRRYAGGNPISLQEFLYPLLQGYDSVALESDIEIGATEQKFNLLAGRTIQEIYGQEKQVVITMPILEGTDGVRKMSKSYGNYIPVNAPANEMFGKLMSIPDAVMERYFRCLTDRSEAEIGALLAGHPKEAKERLARDVVAFYHGEPAAAAAAAEFSRVFSQGAAPDDILTVRRPAGQATPLLELLVEAGLAPSRSEARRLIQQGGVRVNDERVADPGQTISGPGEFLIKAGKRRFLKLIKE